MARSDLSNAANVNELDIDIAIIKSNQHRSGAFPASPTYSQYPHSWLRDGSFIAYAMDLADERDSAAAFHGWVASTVIGHADIIRELIGRRERGEEILEHEFMPTRFSLIGEWQHDGWPNFQLDGYGHWLWSLGVHHRRNGEIAPGCVEAARLVGEYLTAFCYEPCYDAWEEYRSQLHTSTLASIYGGLKSIAFELLPDLQVAAERLRSMILEECVVAGRFVKHIGNPVVDASLLWVSTPFEVVPEGHPLMRATIDEIERTLSVTGGLRRYAADTFYGGGEWVLLTAWLGWYHARSGNTERARECLSWVEAHREENGSLPEQVSNESSNRRFLDYWTGRWGAPAKPLLWSQAMALVLRHEMSETLGDGADPAESV